MQTREFELSVGDIIRVGDRLITLIDVEGAEAAFRIDDLPLDSSESGLLADFLPPAK